MSLKPDVTGTLVRIKRHARSKGMMGANVGLWRAAKMLGVRYPTLKKAVDLGEIAVITFAGQKYIQPSEMERVHKLLAGEP